MRPVSPALVPELAYRFGGCLLSPRRRELRHAGRVVELQPLVFDMLVYFLDRAGQVIDKDSLLQDLWRSPFVSDSVVARAVMKARRAIGDDARDPSMLHTLPRVGYRFSAPVERVAEALAESSIPEVAADAERRGLVLLPFRTTEAASEPPVHTGGLTGLLQHALMSCATPAGLEVTVAADTPIASDADALAIACARSGAREGLLCRVRPEGDGFRLVALRGASAETASRHELHGQNLAQLVLRLAEHLVLEPRAAPPVGASSAAQLPSPTSGSATEPVSDHTVDPESLDSVAGDGFWEEQFARAAELVEQGLCGPADRLLAACAQRVPASFTHELLRAQIGLYACRLATARRHGEEALRMARRVESPELQVEALSMLARIEYRAGRLTAAQALCDQALELARHNAGARARAVGSLVTLTNIHGALGRHEQGIQWGERAVATALATGNVADECLARTMVARCMLAAGRSFRAMEILEQTYGVVRREKLVGIELIVTNFIGLVHEMRQRLLPALEWARRSIALSSFAGHVFVLEMSLALELNLLIRLGRVDEALARLDTLDPDRLSTPVTRYLIELERANALWRSGRRAEGLGLLRTLTADTDEAAARGRARAIFEFAMDSVTAGDPGAAREALARLDPGVDAAAVARVQAAIALASGDRSGALQALRSTWSQLPLDDSHAVLLAHDLAWMLLEDGELDEVEMMMTQVLDVVDHFPPARLLRHAYLAVRNPGPGALADWPRVVGEAGNLAVNCPALLAPEFALELRSARTTRLQLLLLRACW